MKKLLLYIALFFGMQQVHAQEYIMRQFPKIDTIPKTKGPNLKDYNAAFYSFGYLFGPTDSSASDVYWSRSFWLSMGGRYKNKRTEFFNTGFDYSFDMFSYRIAQTDKKRFADTIRHHKEKFVQFSMSFSYFFRFNLTKRGNHLGKYIDVFATGTWSPFNRYIVYDKISGYSSAKLEKSVFTKLEFVDKFYYKLGIRYGISFFQIMAFYRPDNLFKRTADFPYAELPRFGAGIMLDIGDE